MDQAVVDDGAADLLVQLVQRLHLVHREAAGLVGELGELTEGEASAGSEARACVESRKQPGRALLEAPRGREQGRVDHGEHGEQHRTR